MVYWKTYTPMTDFYTSTQTLTPFFDSNPYTVGINNVDLREELHRIIWIENRGPYLLYRKTRFENGYPKKCVCFHSFTQEPDLDTKCNICDGLGYVFDDYIIRGHKSHSQAYSGAVHFKGDGKQTALFNSFYLEHNIISVTTGNNLDIPTPYDKIIEIDQDIDAKFKTPLKQLVRHDILSVDAYRLEADGRIEYYRIRTKANPIGSYLV